MKKIIFILIVIFLNLSAYSQRFDWVTSAGYSGIANSFNGAVAIARDSQGNLYTLDSANGQQICQGVTANPAGGTSIFLYKFNALGALQYIKSIGTNFTPLNVVIGDNDNVYVLGALSGTSEIQINNNILFDTQNRNYIFKLDPSGNVIWRTKNDVSFSGFTDTPMLLFANNHIYFQSGGLTISKLDTDGQFIASLTPNSFLPATAITNISFKGAGVLANGDLVFSATSRGTITYDSTTLIPTGNTLETPMLTLRTTENLGFVWATYTNGLRNPEEKHIPMTVGNDNGIYIGIQVNGTLTAGSDTITNPNGYSDTGTGAVLKMDADGNKIWLKSTTNRAFIYSILNNSDGSGVLCSGEVLGTTILTLGTTSVNSLNGNSLITKLDYNGTFQNSFTFTGFSTFAKCLATNNLGDFYVGGKLKSKSTPIFSCIERDVNAGLYLGKFSELPDTAPTPTITANGAELTASPVFAGTIQWKLNGIEISGESNQTYTATQNGNYTVSYSLADYTACVSNSNTIVISNLATNDFENLNNVIKLYPNPVEDVIHFSIQNNTIEHLKLVDINGRVVMESSNNIKSLNVSKIPPGFYLLQIKTELGSISKKIIKK